MALSEREALRINLEGRSLEKTGRIAEAIALYENGIAKGTDTPSTYRRLRILYRKLKRPEDVERIKRLMIEQWVTGGDRRVSLSAHNESLAYPKVCL